MLSTKNIKDAKQRRLAWRCRRGMLELDIVLKRFMENHFNELNIVEMQTFDEMLALPDNEFWVLLSSPIDSNLDEIKRTVLARMTGQQT